MTHDRDQLESAVAGRLRQAFADVHASSELAARIRAECSPTPEAAEPAQGAGWRARRIAPWLPRVLMAAAAVVLVAVPLWLYLSSTAAVAAAQADLVRVHEETQCRKDCFHQPTDDPARLHAYLHEQLGTRPAAGMRGRICTCGCCIRQFLGNPAASLAVDTPDGPVTVLVTRTVPAEAGLAVTTRRDGRAYYTASCQHCNLAATQAGELHYYAVGKLSPEQLIAVLADLCRDE